MSIYPKLRDSIQDSIMSFIQRNGISFQKNILSLVKMESAYTNTKHDEFITNQYVHFHFIDFDSISNFKYFIVQQLDFQILAMTKIYVCDVRNHKI